MTPLPEHAHPLRTSARPGSSNSQSICSCHCSLPPRAHCLNSSSLLLKKRSCVCQPCTTRQSQSASTQLADQPVALLAVSDICSPLLSARLSLFSKKAMKKVLRMAYVVRMASVYGICRCRCCCCVDGAKGAKNNLLRHLFD